MMTNLTALGWNADWAGHFGPFGSEGLMPARIARQDRDAYLMLWEHGEALGQVSGRFRHRTRSPGDFPAIGDWVAAEIRPAEQKGTIHAVLPRRSSFTRRAAGGPTQDQVIAANIDTAFLVSGLDCDLNLRRVERYLALSYDSGAAPVVVLNKADICPDSEARLTEVQAVTVGVPILVVSASTLAGLAAFEPYLQIGTTSVMLGSSGVGKSSLVNRLLGEDRLQVQAVRTWDSHGRHTTTHRELIPLPQGGLIIDTPGMRELQLWAGEESVQDAFGDVEELARLCRFRDCNHDGEPGCAVIEAIERGQLPVGRLGNYRRLRREIFHLEKKQAQRDRLTDKRSRRQSTNRKNTFRHEGEAID